MTSPSRSWLFAAGLSGSIVATRMPVRRRKAVKPHDLPREWRVLSRHADVRPPDPAIANQSADDELNGIRGDSETQTLRAGNDRGVHADDFAARVDERPAGVPGVERRVGLNDVVHQPARPRSQRSAERADDAGGDRRREPERVADGDHELANLNRLRVAELQRGAIPTPMP